MSCKHGNWAPCDECDEEDAAWRTAYAAGVKTADEETTRLRQQLAIAVRALGKLAMERGCGCSFPCRCNDADSLKEELGQRIDKAQQALAQIRELEK